MKTKKDKLVALKQFADLETGQLYTDNFTYENTLYHKALHKKALDARITKCRKCFGLNLKRFTEACPGWGDLNAKIFFIGQSLHEPGVSSNLPFILGSGFSIDAALRLSGLFRKDVFFTNVVHCHPPSNRASTDSEKKNCFSFLLQEVAIISPKLLIALGNDAHQAVDLIAGMEVYGSETAKEKGGKYKKIKILKLKHPASFMYSAPEERIQWIVKLSMEMDKCLKK